MSRVKYKGDPMRTKHADVWDETDKQGVKHHHERSRLIYSEECEGQTSSDFQDFCKYSTFNFLRILLTCGGTASLIVGLLKLLG